MGFSRVLVTGASGFLGRAVIEALREARAEGQKAWENLAEIRALVQEGDPLAANLPAGIQIVSGDICRISSLFPFFADADRDTCVIHCAGMVSIASRPGYDLWRVNVDGTENILWWCVRRGVGRLVYVSSVHAIPEAPKGSLTTESAVFAPEYVRGAYGRSKAAATATVFAAARRGLNASVVFPSGLIGPGGGRSSGISSMLVSFLAGKLPFAVRGGYDFADVRDVARGIAACAEKGRSGHGYILSGEYATIREMLEAAREVFPTRRRVRYLPLWMARAAAPFCERRCLRRHQPLFFTPAAVEALSSGARFSRKAAAGELGYHPRCLQESIRDTVLDLLPEGRDG